MSGSAGAPVYPADVNHRVGGDQLTSDSATYGATESGALMSATIAAVNGARYAVTFTGNVSSDVAGDIDGIRIREDNATGAQIAHGNKEIGTTSAAGIERHIYTEWTATATGSKTFVVTGVRWIGTGTAHRIRASTTRPTFLTINRIL